MLDQTIETLQTQPANSRYPLVAEWAASKNRTRLKLLAATYRASPDPLLRQLATEADTFARNDMHVETHRPDPDMENLRDSVTAFTLGDRMRAVNDLHSAIRANSAWASHPIIADYAAMVMRVAPDEAVRLLNASGSETAFSIARGAHWWQQQELLRQNITRWTVIRNLLLLGVVTGLGLAAVVWIFMSIWPQEFGISAVPSALIGVDLMGGNLATISPLASIAIVGLVLMTGQTLLLASFINLIARLVSEQHFSTFLRLLHRLSQMQFWINLVSVAAFCLLLLLSAESLRRVPLAQFGSVDALANQLAIWRTVSVAAYLVLMTRAIMHVYRVSILKAVGLLWAGELLLIAALIAVALLLIRITG